MQRLMHTALAVMLALLLAACTASPPPRYQQESYVFGTRVEVTVAGLPTEQAAPAVAAVLADLDRLHRKLHAWQPGSDLVRLNQAFASGQQAAVDAEMTELLQLAQDGEQRSQGRFNPAIGQLIQLWGFHADRYAARLPDEQARQALLAAAPSMADVELAGDQARSRNRAVAVDLGGLAKGWALDRSATILREHGVRQALVNIGGNVLALGEKAPGEPWRVGLQHPREPRAMAVIALRDGEALGTSGDYQRFFEVDGRRYCHLVNPADGTADCRREAVSVLVNTGERPGLRSDVATKSLYFAPAADLTRSAAAFGIGDFLLVDGEGRITLSESMARRVHWLDPAPARVTVLPTEKTRLAGERAG